MKPEQWKKAMNLVRLMRRLPKKNFHMASYSPNNTKDTNGLFDYAPAKHTTTEAIKCGTSCCVAGWGAIQNYEAWPKYPSGDLDVGEGEFAEFYGFSKAESERICLGSMEFTPYQKADQIERILNTKRYTRAREGALG